MIVELQKYLIYGRSDEMDRFFGRAQEAGFLEFLQAKGKKTSPLSEEARLFLSAIKIAKKRFVSFEEESDYRKIVPLQLAESLKNSYEKKEALLEEKRTLKAEITRVHAFGNFSRKELEEFELEGKRVVQFFCMKSKQAAHTALADELLYIGTEYDLDYFVGIHKEKVSYPKMIEMEVPYSLLELKNRLHKVEEEMAREEKFLQSASQMLPLLQEALFKHLDQHALLLAKEGTEALLDGALFGVEAWVPKTKSKALGSLLQGLSIQAELIKIDKAEVIPTYMENRRAAKLGEDLVRVYDTPAAGDKDPSFWVLLFFSLFFAMIISDAGYGLIYLIIGLFVHWKFPKMKGAARRFVKLLYICSTACILWGVLTGSYFGIDIGPENPLRKTSFLYFLASKKAEYHLKEQDDVYQDYVQNYPEVQGVQEPREFFEKAVRVHEGKEEYVGLDMFYDNLFMEFSFIAGILHISLGLLRYFFRNWASLGWAIFIVGGYLFFPSMLDATSLVNFMGWIPKETAHPVGLQLTLGGIGLAFVLALFQKGWGAFHEILNVVQVFADVLSYLRLYALALGGMVLARTFNDHLGMDLGIVFGTVILLLGHAMNLILSVMGGVIHGLRLNFLEWYHYCFEGGGRLFRPLKLNKFK